MRRIIYAASFADDADRIAAHMEAQFGKSRADAFIGDLNRFCELVASQPGVGRQYQGYDTTLYGVVHDVTWIFFQFDALKRGSFISSTAAGARGRSPSD